MLTLSGPSLGNFLTLMLNYRTNYMPEVIEEYNRLRRCHEGSLARKTKGIRATRALHQRPYWLPQVHGPQEAPKLGKAFAVTPEGILMP